MMEREIEESQNGTNPRYPDFRQFLEVTEEILQKSLSKNSDSMIDSAVSFLPLSIFHPGNRTSARVNFGTRTSAQISKNFINFGTN